MTTPSLANPSSDRLTLRRPRPRSELVILAAAYVLYNVARGLAIGGEATADANARWILRGKTDALVIETVSSAPPSEIVEHNVGAGGRRRASGTYRLERLPTGGTRVTFEYAWREAPLAERLLSPLVRAVMRRPLARSMLRLAEELGTTDDGAR